MELKIKIIWMFIVMLCASLSASAYDFVADGLYYTILSEEDRTVAVVGQRNVSGDLEIPRKVICNSKTYTVTRIGDEAFEYNKRLTSVTIPNSVTSIGYGAFSYCSGLTSVTIGNSVTSIGDNAFYSCSGLTSVTIGNSVTSIGYYAFYSCSGLTSVTIPNSVTSIGGYAFNDCSGLTSVTIGNSVTSIGDRAFYECSSLENINVELGNNNYSSIDGILYNKDQTSLLCCPGAKISVTIPNSVTSIGNYAFSYCSGLTSVTIPNSVTSIGDDAFSSCIGLTSVTIGNSVTSIGDWAFSYCSGLTSVTIPNSVTSIGDDAFSYCSGLTSVTIPNSVTSIGDSAFSCCIGLTSVTIGNSVTSIGDRAFGHCSGLTSVTIPNSVTSIGNYAFGHCSGLTSVTIGNSVTSIGENAFRYCDEIKDIYMQCEVPIECKPGFSDNILKTTVLHIPMGTLTEYEKVDPWCNFWNIEELPEVKAEEIILSNDTLKLFVNETSKLEVEIFPSNTSVKHIEWYSDDPSVATVDQDGIVKGLSAGTTSIFASCGEAKASCIVNVVERVGFKDVYNSVTYNDMSLSTSESYFNYIPEIVGPFSEDDFWIELWFLDKDNRYNQHVATINEGEYAGNYANTNLDRPMWAGKYIFNLTSKGTNPNVVANPSRAYLTVNSASNNLEWNTDSPISVKVGEKVDLGITYQADLWCTFNTDYNEELIELSSYGETENNPHWFITGLKEGETTLYFGIECKKNDMGFYDFTDSKTLSKRIVVEPTSGINGVAGEHSSLSVAVTEGRIHILNKDSKDVVRVFSTQGLLLIETIDSEIYNLATGLYVVTIGNKSFKVKI